MSYDNFFNMLIKYELLEENFTVFDANMTYNFCIDTNVEETEISATLDMTFNQFVEALARYAHKACPIYWSDLKVQLLFSIH